MKAYKPTDARLRANSPKNSKQADADFRSPKRLINELGSRADVFHRQPWVKGAYFALDGSEGCGRITFGSDIKNHGVGVVLPQWDVDARLGSFAKRLIVGGLHNADNLQEILAAGQLQSFAKRVLIRPILGSHRVIDDGDGSRDVTIVLGKVAAGDKRDSQC